MPEQCFCQEAISDSQISSNFRVRLEKVARLFLELLQTSKLLNTHLSMIHLVCEIAKFIEGESDLHFGVNKKEQFTQTRLVLHDFDPILNATTDVKSGTTHSYRSTKTSTKANKSKQNQHDTALLNKTRTRSSCTTTITSNKKCNLTGLSKSTGGENKSKRNEDIEDAIADETESDDSEFGPKTNEDSSQFNCTYCGKVFINKRNLKCHLWIHEREKCFECEVCQKKFLRSHQLNRHRRIHTGEKPYVCKTCGKGFCDGSNLNVHLKGHDRNEQPQTEIKQVIQQYEKQNDSDQAPWTDIRNSTLESTEKGPHQLRTTRRQRPAMQKMREKEKPASGTNTHNSTLDCSEKEKGPRQLQVTCPKRSVVQKMRGREDSKVIKTRGKCRRIESQQSIQNVKFTCQICEKTLNNKAALLAHMKCHVNNHEFRCEFCQKEFTELIELKGHRREHGGERPYICDVCGKGFKSQGSMRGHITTHTGHHPYKCDICGKSFSQTSGLNLHKLKHTAEEEENVNENTKQLKCDICGRSYQTKFRLSVHKKFHDSKRDMKCDFCVKKFHSAKDLSIHMRSHTNDKYRCRTCGTTFKSRSLYYFHTRTHPIDRPHLCSVCGKSFSRSYDLTTHRRSHTEAHEKQMEHHACQTCGKVYQMKNSLKVHMKIHLGIFDHECEFCDKKFKSHAELRHHRRVHTQEKPYTCETCQRSFSRQSTLVNHRRTHSGERPYLCIVCGSAFKLSSTLKKHQKVHARENQGKAKGKATAELSVSPPQPSFPPDIVSSQATPTAQIFTQLPTKSPPVVQFTQLSTKPSPAVQFSQLPTKPSPVVQFTLLSTKPSPAVQFSQLPTKPSPVVQFTQLPSKPPTLQLIQPQPVFRTSPLPQTQIIRELQTSQSLIVTDGKKQELSAFLQSGTPGLLHNRGRNNLQQEQLQQTQSLIDLANTPTITMLQMRDTTGAADLFELRDTMENTTAARTFMATSEVDFSRDPTGHLVDTDLEPCETVKNMMDGTRSTATPTSSPHALSNSNFQTYFYY